MGDIAQRGNKLTKGPHGHASQPHLSVHAKGGRAGKFGGGRTNLLEQLGRVEAEPSNRNRRAEISRVHGELNRGYKTGGRVGLKKGGKPWGTGPKPGTHEFFEHHINKPRKGKAIGGAVKIGKRFLDFIKTGKAVDKHGVKVNVPKAAERLTGKPHVDHGKRKRIKHLGKGKAEGGRIGKAAGGWTKIVRPSRSRIHEMLGGGERGKPHSTQEGRQASGKRLLKRTRQKALDDMHDEAWAGKDPEKGKPHSSKEGRIAGGRQNFKRWAKQVQGLKKGGKADKNWIQKAVNPKHKGYCTPMTKKTCTPARKALARTFKKKAKTGWS